MNEVKRDELLRGQTTVAQKVYSIVPITEMWTSETIHHELIRSGAVSRMERAVLQGCLRALCDAKLVKEATRNYFTRVAVTSKATVTQIKEGVAMPEKETEVESVGIPKRLKTLAKLLRSASDELELMSLEIEEHAAENEKLRQLKTLLKAI